MTDPFKLTCSYGTWEAFALYVSLGLLVSLGVGECVLDRLQKRLRTEVREGVRKRARSSDSPAIVTDPFYPPILPPPWIGRVERIVFTAGFALFPLAAFGTAGGYVVLKLNSNWLSRGNGDSDRSDTDDSDKIEHYENWVSGYRMRALILDVTSMAFAFLGGLIVGLAPYVDKLA